MANAGNALLEALMAAAGRRGDPEVMLHAQVSAIGFYERCLKYPPVGKGVLYNLGVLYEDNDMYDKATDCYRRLAKADPTDERAKLFVKDAEASLGEL